MSQGFVDFTNAYLLTIQGHYACEMVIAVESVARASCGGSAIENIIDFGESRLLFTRETKAITVSDVLPEIPRRQDYIHRQVVSDSLAQITQHFKEVMRTIYGLTAMSPEEIERRITDDVEGFLTSIHECEKESLKADKARKMREAAPLN
ncbi:MAG TPA: hypothetical protein VNA68_01815 [Candidatus Dormibacteraeota bacterium]|nr:hypothetical protein [Candidatus Dormibacteraeota bacterium]